VREFAVQTFYFVLGGRPNRRSPFKFGAAYPPGISFNCEFVRFKILVWSLFSLNIQTIILNPTLLWEKINALEEILTNSQSKEITEG
jgi:hypothetical protein